VALKTAPEEFRYHLAVSLRVRGRQLREYPSQKLKPVKPPGGDSAQSGIKFPLGRFPARFGHNRQNR